MTRYPRQFNREYLSCRSGGLNKIQMIDGSTFDLHEDLVMCDRRRRYIVEHQLPTVFQQSDSFHASSPSGSLVSVSIRLRVPACSIAASGAATIRGLRIEPLYISLWETGKRLHAGF